MNVWRSVVLLALAVGIVLGPVPVARAATPRVIQVSPSGDDSTGNGSVASPFRSISHAIAAASPGTTIIVEPGTYSTMIALDKSVTVESDSDQIDAVSKTVIDAKGQSHGVWIHGVAASGSVVRGFTLKNADDQGILVEDTAHVLVEDNVVTNNALQPADAPRDYRVMAEDKAIQLEGTSDTEVQNNTVSENKHGGIAVLDSQTNPAVGNDLAGNRVTNNHGDCGIVLASYLPGKGLRDNVVERNDVTGNVAGIVVAADPPGTSTVGTVVRGNLVAGNQLPGIIIHSNAADQVVSGTEVSENTIRQNGADPGIRLNEATGIVIAGAVVPVTNTTLRANTISDESVPVWQFDPTARPQFAWGNLLPSTNVLPSVALGLALFLVACILVIRSVSRKRI